MYRSLNDAPPSVREAAAKQDRLPATFGALAPHAEGAAPPVRKPRNKFGAQAVTIDGHRFPSKREGAYYVQLCLRLKAGDLQGFCIQPRFPLPGGVWYVSDYVIWENDGRVRVVDVKGGKATMTPMYRRNKKQMRAVHGIELEEV